MNTFGPIHIGRFSHDIEPSQKFPTRFTPERTSISGITERNTDDAFIDG
jgi:hypothetical protein